jgi:23S rRNA U2552 (ribose-2'-O)-methylase RlmE/FtsJ
MTKVNTTTAAELLELANTEAVEVIRIKTDKLSEKQIIVKAMKKEINVVDVAERIALENTGDDELLQFDVVTAQDRQRLVIALKYKAQLETLQKFDTTTGIALGQAAADMVTEKVAPGVNTLVSFFKRVKRNCSAE